METGSIIACPHCEGTGYRLGEYDMRCPICANNDVDGPDWGALELPLSPDHADAVYANCCSMKHECLDMVCQPWDREGDVQWCADCDARGSQCLTCYQQMREAEELMYATTRCTKLSSW